MLDYQPLKPCPNRFDRADYPTNWRFREAASLFLSGYSRFATGSGTPISSSWVADFTIAPDFWGRAIRTSENLAR